MKKLPVLSPASLRLQRPNAFSLLEVLSAVTIIGILAAVAFNAAQNLNRSSQESKLQTDVASLNQSLAAYEGNGGVIGDLSSPQAILDKLKSTRAADAEGTYAGLKGSFIDKRLHAVLQTTSEASSSSPRAVWNSTKKRFEISSTGAGGIARFVLNDSLATIDYGAEVRESNGIAFNQNDGWIWNYSDASTTVSKPAPTLVPVTSAGGTTQTVQSTLARPLFSVPGGDYSVRDFPLTLSLLNPNPSGISEIYYQIAGLTGWLPYVAPLSVQPDMYIVAYTRPVGSSDGGSASVIYTDSLRAYEYYRASNQVPDAVDDVINYLADGSSTLPNILANDSDADPGTTLSVSAVNGSLANVGLPMPGPGGAFSADAEGNVSFVPSDSLAYLNEGQIESTVYNYTVSDGDGGASSASIYFSVIGINDAPYVTAPIEDIRGVAGLPSGETESIYAPNASEPGITTAASRSRAWESAYGLFGNGVEIVSANSNVRSRHQVGTISGASTILPGVIDFDEGLILSSGNVQGILGENTSDKYTFSHNAYNTINDPLLGRVFDHAIIQIGFIPTGSRFTGNYIFGSEEYNEWVFKGFNDSAGIFVNGTNVSELPGGHLLSVDAVNNFVNSDLYIDNEMGSTGAPYQTQMDGFTRTLSFDVAVNPGAINYLSIGIGDVGDSILDSWLILQANSISSYDPEDLEFSVDLSQHFDDPDSEDDPTTLIYTAMLGNGNPLPSYMTLNGTVLSGSMPVSYTPYNHVIQVTATDRRGASAATGFTIYSHATGTGTSDGEGTNPGNDGNGGVAP